MHVRKFEANTLDEALKEIKQELGPDAIILKTVTNKGIKGAFKKKKIEITAAISEKSYTKKRKVDTVLTPDQRSDFYSEHATSIAKKIDRYSGDESTSSLSSGYGQVSLNRTVQTTKSTGPAGSRGGLDDFLQSSKVEMTAPAPMPQITPSAASSLVNEFNTPTETTMAPVQNMISEEVYNEQVERIQMLEQRILEIGNNLQKMSVDGPLGLQNLRTTLKTIGITEAYIQRVMKKAIFELSEEEQEDTEAVFEFALREMNDCITVGMPLFSSVDSDVESVITVLVSETSAGQTTMVSKLAALNKGAKVIRKSADVDSEKSFSEKVFGIDVVNVNTISEVISECRKAVERGQSVFVDYKNTDSDVNETKKFINGLKRSFEHVEVLISLSAIQSEMYNRKVVNDYGVVANGLVISHLDHCLDYGSLFNLAESVPELPFKFYGTGETVPDDIESATSERIIAGIFQL